MDAPLRISEVVAEWSGLPPGKGNERTSNPGVVSTKNTEGIAASLRNICGVSGAIEQRLRSAVGQIEMINLQTKLLSFNAQIEAAHAGVAGRAFEVVAREMVALSGRTAESAQQLDEETQRDIRVLNEMIDQVGSTVRGTRLSDLAFTNIDLIDRNLYERSCDVRWWATDASCVDAARDPEKAGHAGRRLGVILDSYTVYYDIVLCDVGGRIIANGRPEKFACGGTDQSSTGWFQSAMATRSGAEFGFQGLHCSPTLAGGHMVLVYSAMVREGGRAEGAPLGCLGIVFNWEALAQTIVLATQVGEAEKKRTRVLIVDENKRVIADNQGRHLQEEFALKDFEELLACKKGYAVQMIERRPHLIAYASSPGFETYATGWHSFILQPLTLD